jgi:hypothetical protein
MFPKYLNLTTLFVKFVNKENMLKIKHSEYGDRIIFTNNPVVDENTETLICKENWERISQWYDKDDLMCMLVNFKIN